MAVNNNFYTTINGLVEQATKGSTTPIVDYDSFIEVGKSITDIQNTDLQNNFITALMNRISMVINTARNYEGSYKELTRGSLDYGNTIELIIQQFYDAQAAAFVDLVDGTSVDQYKIYKPKANVDYYVDTVAYKIPITIQYDQLKKAFTGPGAMDSFIADITMYVMNSNELKREAGRIALVAKLIVDTTSADAATSTDTPARHYKLLSLYNTITGANLTTANALYNAEFIKFAISTINKVTEKTKKVSESYNKKGIKTFTRAQDRHLFVNSALVSAKGTYVFPDAFNNSEEISLRDYINVPYWQNEKSPLTVTYEDPENSGQSLTTEPVLAVLCDKFAIGEYVRKQDMRTTPFNADGEYWNNFLNVELKYLVCESANSVVFTLA